MNMLKVVFIFVLYLEGLVKIILLIAVIVMFVLHQQISCL